MNIAQNTDRFSMIRGFFPDQGNEPMIDTIIDEIRIMYRYSRDSGISLDELLREKISAIFDGDVSTNVDLNMAMSVHDLLTSKVGPATPDTIKASNMTKNWSLTLIASITALAILALLAIGFLTPLYPQLVTIRTEIEPLCGAIIGAGFYAFWTARPYILDGVFSRKYSQDYIIRFGLGIVAGIILGLIAKSYIAQAGVTENQTTANTFLQFSPLIIAIVGGFTSEAVVQILKRISDILVAAISGSDKERVKAEADKKIAKKLNQIAADLNKAGQETEPDKIRDRLKEITKELLK